MSAFQPRRFLANVTSNVGLSLFRLAVMFVMTPVLFSNLGSFNYGIWEMVASVLGYAGLMRASLWPTASRYSARYLAKGDRNALQEVLSTIVVLLFAFGTITGLGLILASVLLPPTLEGENGSAFMYAATFWLLAAHTFLLSPRVAIRGFLEGYQEFVLVNRVEMIVTIIVNGIVLLIIDPQNALIVMAASGFAANALKMIVFAYYLARHPTGAARIDFRSFRRSRVRELYGFGGKSLIQGISGTMESRTDALVIGFALGPATVPLYMLAANVTSRIYGLLRTATQAFMPMFSSLQAGGEQERSTTLYLQSSRWIVAVAMPAFTGTAVIGAPFLTLWIGPEIGEGADPIVAVLCAFALVPMLDPLQRRYLVGVDKQRVLTIASPLGAIANLLLSLALVWPLGVVGVALGSLIPRLVTVPLFSRIAFRAVGMDAGVYLRQAILPAVLPTALMGLVVIQLRSAWGLDTYGTLALSVMAGGVVYALAYLLIGMSREERATLLRQAGRMLSTRRQKASSS
jgi:O-antigen/teichoic acid export membrane protein